MTTKAKAPPARKATAKVTAKPVLKAAVKPLREPVLKPVPKPTTKPTTSISGMNDPWQLPPATMEESLTRIQVLGERIEEQIKFMTSIAKLNGTSMEAKQKAVGWFYERLFALEQELAQIQEYLRLG